MERGTSRRQFLKRSTLAGAGLWLVGGAARALGYAANEKLDIAGIGVGGRGASDIGAVSSENIVALCDVDVDRARGTVRRFTNARFYRDFRVMLEKEAKAIDAVVVATPDHVHAPASIMAMKLGKHVYCEKPLTHSVYEARRMREVAIEKGVTTQMGNQGTASSELRQGAEVIRAGAIGRIREIHVWSNRPIWPQGVGAILRHKGVHNALHGPMTGAGPGPRIRDTLAWDLWLGPAPERPYDPVYLPFTWRGWWDFGTGALGDMACHTMNLAFMALELVDPFAIEAEVSFLNPETAPEWSIIRYEFAARGDRPPLTMTWYDGGKKPPAELLLGQKMAGSGLLFIGDKGRLYSPGDTGTGYRLLPEKDFAGYEPPTPTIPRSPGHHREWIRACKGGPPTMSNFGNYAGPLAEMVLLGNVAMRAGRRIEWDAKALKVTNVPEANRFVRRAYRKGWTL